MFRNNTELRSMPDRTKR